MTKVLYREYYDKTLIIVEGHSGFSVVGADIVCAGISTLIFTLINCVEDEQADGRLKISKEIIRDGYVCLEFESFDFAKERVEGIRDTCISGLLMLQEHYPQYIEFE